MQLLLDLNSSKKYSANNISFIFIWNCAEILGFQYIEYTCEKTNQKANT